MSVGFLRSFLNSGRISGLVIFNKEILHKAVDHYSPRNGLSCSLTKIFLNIGKLSFCDIRIYWEILSFLMEKCFAENESICKKSG